MTNSRHKLLVFSSSAGDHPPLLRTSALSSAHHRPPPSPAPTEGAAATSSNKDKRACASSAQTGSGPTRDELEAAYNLITEPISMKKKLGPEFKYQDRKIFVSEDLLKFCWAKPKSKSGACKDVPFGSIAEVRMTLPMRKARKQPKVSSSSDALCSPFAILVQIYMVHYMIFCTMNMLPVPQFNIFFLRMMKHLQNYNCSCFSIYHSDGMIDLYIDNETQSTGLFKGVGVEAMAKEYVAAMEIILCEVKRGAKRREAFLSRLARDDDGDDGECSVPQKPSATIDLIEKIDDVDSTRNNDICGKAPPIGRRLSPEPRGVESQAQPPAATKPAEEAAFGSSADDRIMSPNFKRASLSSYASENFQPQTKISNLDDASASVALTPKEMVSWTPHPSEVALTTLSRPSLRKQGLDLFKALCACMGEDGRGYVVKRPKISRGMVIGMALEHRELLDELFCQLVKQTSGNPNFESERRGWQILAACSAKALPNKVRKFFPFARQMSSA